MTRPVSGLSDRAIDYTYIRGTVSAKVEHLPNPTAIIRHMDETTLLLPARSCPSSSSSPSGPVQLEPDRRVLANESGSGSSRVLEAEAHSRCRGLREIAILFRASVPGASSSSHPHPSLTNTISLITLVIFSYTLQLSLQTVSVAVVARLGSTELSVSAFSLMLAFVTG